MRYLLKNWAVVFALAVLGLSSMECTRKTDSEYLGTGIVPAQAGFYYSPVVLTSTGFVKFTGNTGVYVYTEMNQTVSWRVTYKGLVSGAFRAFTGITNKIDSSNTMWKGESDNDRFFIAEQVQCVVKIDGVDSVFQDVLTITQGKTFDNLIINGVRVTLVDDINGTNKLDTSKFDNPYSDIDIREKAVVYANSKFSDFSGYKEPDGTPSRPVEGASCYYLQGIDYNFNTYVAGANTVSLTALAGKINSTDPSDVYINAYVYGFGTKNTALNIILYELDSLTNKKNFPLRYALGYYNDVNNPNYVLDQTNNDVWQILVPVDWMGWKLVSLKYNQFKKHNTKGHLGNNIAEPHKMCGIAIELASAPNFVTTEVKVAFDYVTVTEGGPFSLTKK